MGDLSKHFSRNEKMVACPCGCGQDTIDAELIFILEAVRNHFNQRVHFNSLNRCLAYNRTIPNSRDTSQHIKSKAADIRVENVPAKLVYAFLTMCFPNKYGFGKYSRFTHIDCRSIKARW
jgi:uncharacterized protein YcbK (DUF882 family)